MKTDKVEMRNKPNDNKKLYPFAKPFLKWAGGKGQLLGSIGRALTDTIAAEKFIYIEPFVGSGAVLFWMLEHFPQMEKAVINDINADLVGCYSTIAAYPYELIAILAKWQDEFYAFEDDREQKRHYYYAKRDLYNAKSETNIVQSALFIFLNRTGFNGLYRVNRQGLFNVPMGDYKKPKICDPHNILNVSRALQRVEILCGDFEKTLKYATRKSLFYLDPPYKPLNKTANFTAYAKQAFDDREQIRLRNFCQTLEEKGGKWVLSNSDASSQASEASFFDVLYADFRIERVLANRRISAKASSRASINELLIRNY